MRITGVGREVKGVIYFSLDRCETLITGNKQPVAVFELWMLVETKCWDFFHHD